jgi:kumamolisin
MMSNGCVDAQEWSARALSGYEGPLRGKESIDVTVVLRRRGGAPAGTGRTQGPAGVSHRAFGGLWGADPADIARLRKFAATPGLAEVGCEPHRRVLHLRGSATDLEQAFSVQLGDHQPKKGGPVLLGCTGHPALPEGAIAVLGLDRRPVAGPYVRLPHVQPLCVAV